MTWLLIMAFCAMPTSCENVAIDSFDTQSACEAAVTRAGDKPTDVHVDRFFCQQAGEQHASITLVHQPAESWWWKNYPCGEVNPSTHFAPCNTLRAV